MAKPQQEVMVVAQGNFRVDLEALASSAAHVAGQGDDLASAHLSADNRMAGAQSGWVGESSAALRTRTAAWLATSHTLLTQIGDHAMDLHNDGIAVAALDSQSEDTLRAVGGSDS